MGNPGESVDIYERLAVALEALPQVFIGISTQFVKK